MRKIIQIQSMTTGSICALCDDGTLWLHDASEQGAWRALPAIAGEASDAADKPAQAGKRWSGEDDEQLAQLWCKQRLDARQIAEQVQRTEGAIIARLVRLDFFDDADEARAESRRRRQAE